jgi:hypothetical protein
LINEEIEFWTEIDERILIRTKNNKEYFISLYDYSIFYNNKRVGRLPNPILRVIKSQEIESFNTTSKEIVNMIKIYNNQTTSDDLIIECIKSL